MMRLWYREDQEACSETCDNEKQGKGDDAAVVQGGPRGMLQDLSRRRGGGEDAAAVVHDRPRGTCGSALRGSLLVLPFLPEGDCFRVSQGFGYALVAPPHGKY